MTIYYDLTKDRPEDIVSSLISMCNQAAETGEIRHESPAKMEFKKVWVVNYKCPEGEFSQTFKNKESAMRFVIEIHNDGATESNIKEWNK